MGAAAKVGNMERVSGKVYMFCAQQHLVILPTTKWAITTGHACAGLAMDKTDSSAAICDDSDDLHPSAKSDSSLPPLSSPICASDQTVADRITEAKPAKGQYLAALAAAAAATAAAAAAIQVMSF